jgi:hypothetical protein
VAERVLTRRELNRALLARQLLLERAAVTLPKALERMAGIQNQYAPNAYIRLWSCLEGFRRDDLTRALERRSVVQGTLMRATIHLVSKSDFPRFAAAIRRATQEWWLRVQRPPLEEREVVRRAAKIRARLADGGPLGHDELATAFGRDWTQAMLWLDLVRVPPSGTWERRRANLYDTADHWLGAVDASYDDALDHLVRRYLGAFGPATRKDIAAWSGIGLRELTPALERLSLRSFRDDSGEELLDLPRAPLPPAETPAPVRFLPTWDAVLLVHARRTGILPEKYRPVVFQTKNPPSMPTFLVDGVVAGAWRYENGSVSLEPYRRLDRAVQRELREEAERLVAFHVDDGR